MSTGPPPAKAFLFSTLMLLSMLTGQVHKKVASFQQYRIHPHQLHVEMGISVSEHSEKATNSLFISPINQGKVWSSRTLLRGGDDE